MQDIKLHDEPGRLRALHRYGVLDSIKEPNFDSITSIVKNLLQVPICAVSLVDQDRQWFKSIQGLEIAETCRSMAFCDHTIRTREAMVIPDATLDPRFAANPLVTGDPFIRSYAGSPLKTPDSYNLGSLCVIDQKPRDFGPADIALLDQFARVVIDQLELRTLAHRDFLTGVLTRRAFVDSATAALHQASREGRQSALLVFDVDHFKSINDTYGHPAGDVVLKRIADTVGGLLRPTDLLGRLGGEEFAVLLQGSSEAEAFDCAERLRHAIAADPGAGQPSATASFGIAMVADPTMLDPAIASADCALYAAKRSGRNCTILATPEMAAAA